MSTKEIMSGKEANMSYSGENCERFLSKGYIISSSSTYGTTYTALAQVYSKHLVKMEPLPFHRILATPIHPIELQLSAECRKIFLKNDIKKVRYVFWLEEKLVNRILESRDDSFGSYGVQVLIRFCEYGAHTLQKDYLPDCIVQVNKEIAMVKGKRKEYSRGHIDVTSLCDLKMGKESENKLFIEWLPRPFQSICVSVVVAEKLDTKSIVSKWMTDNVKDPSFMKEMVISKLKSDTDVSCTSLKITMVCPLGKTRIVSPCRGENCTHIQCVDAVTLLKLNEGRPLAGRKCYMCDKPAANLYIDGLFLDILMSVPDSVEEVEFRNDGSWTYAGKDETLEKEVNQKPKKKMESTELNESNSSVEEKEKDNAGLTDSDMDEEEIVSKMKDHISRIQSQVEQLNLLTNEHQHSNKQLEFTRTNRQPSVDDDVDYFIDLTEHNDGGRSHSETKEMEEDLKPGLKEIKKHNNTPKAKGVSKEKEIKKMKNVKEPECEMTTDAAVTPRAKSVSIEKEIERIMKRVKESECEMTTEASKVSNLPKGKRTRKSSSIDNDDSPKEKKSEGKSSEKSKILKRAVNECRSVVATVIKGVPKSTNKPIRKKVHLNVSKRQIVVKRIEKLGQGTSCDGTVPSSNFNTEKRTRVRNTENRTQVRNTEKITQVRNTEKRTQARMSDEAKIKPAMKLRGRKAVATARMLAYKLIRADVNRNRKTNQRMNQKLKTRRGLNICDTSVSKVIPSTKNNISSVETRTMKRQLRKRKTVNQDCYTSTSVIVNAKNPEKISDKDKLPKIVYIETDKTRKNVHKENYNTGSSASKENDKDLKSTHNKNENIVKGAHKENDKQVKSAPKENDKQVKSAPLKENDETVKSASKEIEKTEVKSTSKGNDKIMKQDAMVKGAAKETDDSAHLVRRSFHENSKLFKPDGSVASSNDIDQFESFYSCNVLESNKPDYIAVSLAHANSETEFKRSLLKENRSVCLVGKSLVLLDSIDNCRIDKPGSGGVSSVNVNDRVDHLTEGNEVNNDKMKQNSVSSSGPRLRPNKGKGPLSKEQNGCLPFSEVTSLQSKVKNVNSERKKLSHGERQVTADREQEPKLKREQGQTSERQVTAQRKQGHTSEGQVTAHTKQGHTSKRQVTVQREQSHTTERQVTAQRKQGQTSKTQVTVQREQSHTTERQVTAQRKQGQTSKTQVTVQREQSHTTERQVTAQREQGHTSEKQVTVHNEQGQTSKGQVTVQREQGHNADNGIVELSSKAKSRRQSYHYNNYEKLDVIEHFDKDLPKEIRIENEIDMILKHVKNTAPECTKDFGSNKKHRPANKNTLDRLKDKLVNAKKIEFKMTLDADKVQSNVEKTEHNKKTKVIVVKPEKSTLENRAQSREKEKAENTETENPEYTRPENQGHAEPCPTPRIRIVSLARPKAYKTIPSCLNLVSEMVDGVKYTAVYAKSDLPRFKTFGPLIAPAKSEKNCDASLGMKPTDVGFINKPGESPVTSSNIETENSELKSCEMIRQSNCKSDSNKATLSPQKTTNGKTGQSPKKNVYAKTRRSSRISNYSKRNKSPEKSNNIVLRKKHLKTKTDNIRQSASKVSPSSIRQILLRTKTSETRKSPMKTSNIELKKSNLIKLCDSKRTVQKIAKNQARQSLRKIDEVNEEKKKKKTPLLPYKKSKETENKQQTVSHDPESTTPNSKGRTTLFREKIDLKFKVLAEDDSVRWLNLTNDWQCNWMKFVRPARNDKEKNVDAYLHNRQIFFIAIKPIPKDTELLVGYSKDYARFMVDGNVSVDTKRDVPSTKSDVLNIKDDVSNKKAKDVPSKECSVPNAQFEVPNTRDHKDGDNNKRLLGNTRTTQIPKAHQSNLNLRNKPVVHTQALPKHVVESSDVPKELESSQDIPASDSSIVTKDSRLQLAVKVTNAIQVKAFPSGTTGDKDHLSKGKCSAERNDNKTKTNLPKQPGQLDISQSKDRQLFTLDTIPVFWESSPEDPRLIAVESLVDAALSTPKPRATKSVPDRKDENVKKRKHDAERDERHILPSRTHTSLYCNNDLSIAPSTKKLMKMKEVGISGKAMFRYKNQHIFDDTIFLNPGRELQSKPLLNLFTRRLQSVTEIRDRYSLNSSNIRSNIRSKSEPISTEVVQIDTEAEELSAPHVDTEDASDSFGSDIEEILKRGPVLKLTEIDQKGRKEKSIGQKDFIYKKLNKEDSRRRRLKNPKIDKAMNKRTVNHGTELKLTKKAKTDCSKNLTRGTKKKIIERQKRLSDKEPNDKPTGTDKVHGERTLVEENRVAVKEVKNVGNEVLLDKQPQNEITEIYNADSERTVIKSNSVKDLGVENTGSKVTAIKATDSNDPIEIEDDSDIEIFYPGSQNSSVMRSASPNQTVIIQDSDSDSDIEIFYPDNQDSTTIGLKSLKSCNNTAFADKSDTSCNIKKTYGKLEGTSSSKSQVDSTCTKQAVSLIDKDISPQANGNEKEPINDRKRRNVTSVADSKTNSWLQVKKRRTYTTASETRKWSDTHNKAPQKKPSERHDDSRTSGNHGDSAVDAEIEDDRRNALECFMQYMKWHGFSVPSDTRTLPWNNPDRKSLRSGSKRSLGHLFENFYNRYPEISRGLLKRASDGHFASLQSGNVDSILSKYGIKYKPERIYNCAKFNQMVKGNSNISDDLKDTTGGQHQCCRVSMTLCACTDGKLMSTVVKVENSKDIGNKHKDEEKESELENVDRAVFFDWFQLHFIPKCSQEKPVCLLMDCDSSYLSLPLMETAIENDIVIIGIPTNMKSPIHSQIIDPLKVKLGLGSSTEKSRVEFFLLLKDILENVESAQIEKAFWEIGICPSRNYGPKKANLIQSHPVQRQSILDKAKQGHLKQANPRQDNSKQVTQGHDHIQHSKQGQPKQKSLNTDSMNASRKLELNTDKFGKECSIVTNSVPRASVRLKRRRTFDKDKHKIYA